MAIDQSVQRPFLSPEYDELFFKYIGSRRYNTWKLLRCILESSVAAEPFRPRKELPELGHWTDA